MKFLQPLMLWVSLAVAIPILIHIWNRQKGKVIEWAASRWLMEKSEQRHRGIRIENLLLLALRCLIILLLAALLARPVKDLSNQNTSSQTHFVEPSKRVVETYRFELESALKNGEKVIWLNDKVTEAGDLSRIPATNALSTRKIQHAVRQYPGETHLYFTNSQNLATGAAVYIPGKFDLHAIVDSASNDAIRFTNADSAAVLIDYQNPTETRTVRAALKALISVHHFPLHIDLEQKSGKKYGWTFTDKIRPVTYHNALTGPAPLTMQTSELVSSGRLPEFLGEQILEHYGISSAKKPLSQKQLASLFITTAGNADQSWEKLRKYLFGALLLILIVERGLSLKKTLA